MGKQHDSTDTSSQAEGDHHASRKIYAAAGQSGDNADHQKEIKQAERALHSELSDKRHEAGEPVGSGAGGAHEASNPLPPTTHIVPPSIHPSRQHRHAPSPQPPSHPLSSTNAPESAPPATAPSANPPTLPSPPYDLSTLVHLAESGRVLFRVYDSISVSPLIWTGDPGTSGFAAPNANLAYLDSESYKQVFKINPGTTLASASVPNPVPIPVSGLRGRGRGQAVYPPKSAASAVWYDGPYVRHTMVDHILTREIQSCVHSPSTLQERNDIPPDERSPWISTSTSIFWCLHEIVRRLTLLKRKSVRLAVISHPDVRARALKPDSSEQVWPSHELPPKPVSHPGTGSRSRRGNHELATAIELGESNSQDGSNAIAKDATSTPDIELAINPIPRLTNSLIRAKEFDFSFSMKDAYDLARKHAATSAEVLIWGRVFAESVLCSLEFTPEYSPLTLPTHFYAPPPPLSPTAKSAFNSKSSRTRSTRRRRNRNKTTPGYAPNIHQPSQVFENASGSGWGSKSEVVESSASAPAVGDGYGYGRGSGANRVPIGLASGGGGGMTGTTPRPISGGASGGGTETEALALGNEGGKWLEGLVWDPRIDGSESAKKMVMRRREEVGQGGGEINALF